jgi:hypothetical protein
MDDFLPDIMAFSELTIAISSPPNRRFAVSVLNRPKVAPFASIIVVILYPNILISFPFGLFFSNSSMDMHLPPDFFIFS